MDAAAHYRHLLQLGRDEFLAAAAPAAFVRYPHAPDDDLATGAATRSLDQEAETIEETVPHDRISSPDVRASIEVFPLSKKPGASFPDRITIGRTANNDLVIVEHSISRLHAYVRLDGKQWVVADAGSKNGSWLDTHALQPRKERKLASRAVLRLGDVDLTFLVAADLFTALGGVA